MVLYINGNYPYHSLHGELVTKLAELGNQITVFAPMNGLELMGKYRCDHPGTDVIYSNCLKKPDRVFFTHKMRKIARTIEKNVNMKDVECILAGTLYSDGSVAYLLHKKYNIPFAVALRQTDVTYQMKWRPYLNGFIKQVLHEAESVIFLSPAYHKHLDRFDCDRTKYVTIPNAVNDYWFTDQKESRKCHEPLSLIYTGEVTTLKNVITTISVTAKLNQMNIPTVFHIVGSGNKEKACINLAEQLGVSDRVFFHGWQNGKEKIRAFYDQADIFIMPSLRETFGTVYIEALSQGLPVIYSRGQGIDGFFQQGEIGYSCDPKDINEMTKAVLAITDNYTAVSAECINASKQFQWGKIAEQYNNIICKMRNR